MNVGEFSTVIVRFFGLWLLFQCIVMIEQTISAIIFPLPQGNPGYQTFIIFVSVFNVILYAAVGLVLVWKPQFVADRVTTQKVREAQVRVSTTSLMFLCFSAAGLVFLVDGLKALLYHVTEYAFSTEGPSYFGRYGQTGILPGVFETIVGIWLVFGFKRIVRSLRRVWLAGRTMGITKDDREEQETSSNP